MSKTLKRQVSKAVDQYNATIHNLRNVSGDDLLYHIIAWAVVIDKYRIALEGEPREQFETMVNAIKEVATENDTPRVRA